MQPCHHASSVTRGKDLTDQQNATLVSQNAPLRNQDDLLTGGHCWPTSPFPQRIF